MENKKVIHAQTYTIKFETFDDGSTSLTRTNDGFSTMELLGFLNFTISDIMNMMSGKIKPDIIKRQFVED